jgi:hypothetical protein
MDTRPDIGWKEFAIRIFDLVRWPAVFLTFAILIRAPVGRFVDALAGALHG